MYMCKNKDYFTLICGKSSNIFVLFSNTLSFLNRSYSLISFEFSSCTSLTLFFWPCPTLHDTFSDKASPAHDIQHKAINEVKQKVIDERLIYKACARVIHNLVQYYSHYVLVECHVVLETSCPHIAKPPRCVVVSRS